MSGARLVALCMKNKDSLSCDNSISVTTVFEIHTEQVSNRNIPLFTFYTFMGKGYLIDLNILKYVYPISPFSYVQTSRNNNTTTDVQD